MADAPFNHGNWLDVACAEARQHHSSAGAVLVKGEALIAQSHHRCEALNDPIATAELDCIRRAGRRSDQPELTLYTTGYPDLLCAGTVIQFRIGHVVVGQQEADTAGVNLLRADGVPVTFVRHSGCQQLISP